jgi:membrane-associated PAP2 superfamily phosphatase
MSTSGTFRHGAPQSHSGQPVPAGSAVCGWLWLALIVAVIVFAVWGHA